MQQVRETASHGITKEQDMGMAFEFKVKDLVCWTMLSFIFKKKAGSVKSCRMRLIGSKSFADKPLVVHIEKRQKTFDKPVECG